MQGVRHHVDPEESPFGPKDVVPPDEGTRVLQGVRHHVDPEESPSGSTEARRRRRTGFGRTEKLSSYGKALSMELKNPKNKNRAGAQLCGGPLPSPIEDA